MNNEQTMTKYKSTFTVTKSFEVEVVFEAPNAIIALEMAYDMADEDIEDIGNIVDEIGIIESIELDDKPKEADYQTVKVHPRVKRWCDQWLKDCEEDVV